MGLYTYKVLYSLHVLILFVAIFLCSVWARSMNIEQRLGAGISLVVDTYLYLCRCAESGWDQWIAPGPLGPGVIPVIPNSQLVQNLRAPSSLSFEYQATTYVLLLLTKRLFGLLSYHKIDNYSFIGTWIACNFWKPSVFSADSNCTHKPKALNPYYHSLF